MDQYSAPFSITSQFAFCGLPLRLDTYRGCAFRCSYCFARYRGGNAPSDAVRPADAKHIERIFDLAIEGRSESVTAQFIRRRVPIHFGGMSDPLQPAEEHHRVTAAVLKTLVRYGYPTVLSTRGKLAAKSPYVELLKDVGHIVVQFSLSSTRDSTAKRIEPHSTLPSVLLKTMETLSNLNITVMCRWQPYIPNVSETPAEFIPRVAAAGCRHVLFEHLKLPLERSNDLWQEFTAGAQTDLLSYYRSSGARRDGRELILPPERKLATILSARSYVHSYQMTFGAADNEFQYLSDTACCCSGVDQFAGFEQWFRHQIGNGVRQSRGKVVQYELIAKEWTPTGSIDRFLNSRSRISSRHENAGTMEDHIRFRWNRANAPGRPMSFFGVISDSSSCSSTTDRIYTWDKKVVDQMGDIPGWG